MSQTVGMTAVCVQRVTTRWTKASRGDVGAVHRNAAPVAFAWPTGAMFHDVELNEAQDFQPHHQVEYAVPPYVLDSLSVRSRDGHLTLLPQISPFWMPQRHRRPPRAGVREGEWVRWSINYRVGLDDGWQYGLQTLNVAYGIDEIGSLFLGEPSRSVEELASLR